MSKGLWVSEKTFIRFADKGAGSITQEIATRKGSIDYYSLGYYLPNPDPVLKKQGKDITVYEELLGDAYLGGCVQSRQSGVKSLEWGIDRGKSKSRQARLIEDVFKNLKMEKILDQVINAPLFGYQVFEILWENVGGYVLPRAVVGKPQEWFCFSENNELLYKSKDHRDGAPVNPNQFIVLTHGATYKNPYGQPILGKVFWPVTFKKGGLKFWVVFAEKFGGVFAIGKQPRGTGKQETDAFADSLEQMIQDAVAVIPDDDSVELMEAQYKGASAEIYKGLRDDCKSEIAIAVLGQNLTTEVKGGSYAAAETHMAVRADIVDDDRKLAESLLNGVIERIFALNFGGGERPVFSMWQEEDVDKTLAERDKTLADTGMIRFKKGYFIKNYGFEEEDIEVVEKPDAVNTANSGVPPLPGAGVGENPDPALLKQFKQFLNGVQFASGGTARYPDQDALDKAADNLDPAELQSQMEGILKPIISLIKEGNDYNEVLDRLAEVFPDMGTRGLEEMYGRALYVSELWGLMNAGKD